MGNYSILLVLAAFVVVGALTVSTSTSSRKADRMLNEHTTKFVARQAAHSGLNVTLRRLTADTLSWAINPEKYGFADEPFETAIFSSMVLANYGPTIKRNKCFVDTVDVEVVAAVADSVEHRIQATYFRSCSGDSGVPHEAFGYPLVTDKDMLVEQMVTVKSSTDSTNASVHANGMLTGRGNPDVEGYGTYSTPGGQCDDCHDFLPNNDENGDDPNVFQAPEIPLWEFDPTDFLDISTYVTTGDVWFRGEDVTIDFTNFDPNLFTTRGGGDLPTISGSGTYDDPFVLYVSGNVQFDTNVDFIGYGVIVTEGWVEITDNGNVYAQLPAGVTPPESSSDNPNTAEVRPFIDDYFADGMSLGLAIGGERSFAGEDISLLVRGKSTVMGTIFMNGGIDIPGDATVYGSITAMDDFVLDGKMMVWYEGASTPIREILQLILNAPEGIFLVDFQEW